MLSIQVHIVDHVTYQKYENKDIKVSSFESSKNIQKKEQNADDYAQETVMRLKKYSLTASICLHFSCFIEIMQ